MNIRPLADHVHKTSTGRRKNSKWNHYSDSAKKPSKRSCQLAPAQRRKKWW